MDTDNQIPEFDSSQVEDSVGYLLARSRTMLSRSIEDALRRVDITHAQGSVFMMLATGKISTAAELARDLFIDSAAMKRTLDKLEAKGYIQRVIDASDKRLFKLELTPSGKAMAAQLPAIYAEVLDVGFSGFAAEEITFLKYLLRKLLANRPILEAKMNSCSGN
ncbi:MarR family winged helix-turn-helix transcriptional regulator [Undibacterium sp. Ji50W]|uniref:MarR family winged helix-turn-helix transcriptional regulator n=1 Tax=Undibacterium sp. Ji50W TaxID=3413041 RepID=UPI003BEF751F